MSPFSCTTNIPRLDSGCCRRFKAEIAFSGDQVAQRCLEGLGREQLHARLRKAASTPAPAAALDGVLREYGRCLVSSVGAEVDRCAWTY